MTENVRYAARVLVINDFGKAFSLRGRDATLHDRAPQALAWQLQCQHNCALVWGEIIV